MTLMATTAQHLLTMGAKVAFATLQQHTISSTLHHSPPHRRTRTAAHRNSQVESHLVQGKGTIVERQKGKI